MNTFSGSDSQGILNVKCSKELMSCLAIFITHMISDWYFPQLHLRRIENADLAKKVIINLLNNNEKFKCADITFFLTHPIIRMRTQDVMKKL